MNNIFRIFLSLLLSLNLITLYAQSLQSGNGVRVVGPDIIFEHIYSFNGLPDDRIRSLYQDSRGFLWIGTMNGISRYDGYSFTNFFKNNTANSVSGNWAYAITEDRDGSIWIGTKEGLSKYDVRKDVFTNFLHKKGDPSSIAGNSISSLLFDHTGKLWIGTSSGLSVYNPTNQKFTNFNNYPFKQPISKIIASYNHYIWIATSSCVIHFQVTTGQYRVYPFAVRPNAYGDRVWSMLEDNRNLYLTTGGDGLIRFDYDAKSNDYKPFVFNNSFDNSPAGLDNTEVFDIAKSNSGDMWLATNRGLAKIESRGNARRLLFFRNNMLNSRTISDNQAYKVFIDRADVLWCGTEYGLNKLDLHLLPFHSYTFGDKEAKAQVRCIASVGNDDLWIGTIKSGFYNFNLRTNLCRNFWFDPVGSPLNSNRSVMANGDQIHFGTLGGALQFPASSVGSKQLKIDGHAVFSMFRDRRGSMWYATYNGLYKESSTGEMVNLLDRIRFPKNRNFEFVRTLFEDTAGNIWLGFENQGIGYFGVGDNVFHPVIEDATGDAVFGNIIYAMTESPRGTIWAASESGLSSVSLHPNGKYEINNFSTKEGLPDKSINGIIADNQAYIWLSTKKGLARFDVKSGQVRTYLANVPFNCCCKVSENLFAFGTSEGFITFNPKEIVVDNMAPKVVITDLRLMNKSVAVAEKVNGDVVLDRTIQNTSEITLNHNNNQFTLEFAALHFSAPKENRYAYKMEGFDEDWTLTDASNRTATYTNLNAGTYTFEVRACNNSGVWSTQSALLKIKVLPPPWKSWWAITIYIILLLAVTYLIVRYMLINLNQKQQIQIDRMEKEQLRNMDKMKMSFFTDISHEFRTPLSLIVGPVEELLASDKLNSSVKSQIQLIYRNSKKLLYLIDELMTFQKMEQGKLKLKKERCDLVAFMQDIYDNFTHFAAKKRITFTINKKTETLTLAIDKGKIEMVLNNLIFNAFKFVPEGGTVSLTIEKCDANAHRSLIGRNSNEWVSVSVADNGRGISPEGMAHLFDRFYSEKSDKGTGVGLSLSKNLVEMHNGTIVVESTPDVSTVFRVFLPLSQPGEVVEESAPEVFVSDYEPDMGYNDLVVPASEFLPAGQSKQATVLVVDDNEDVLDFLEHILGREYEIIRAVNGAVALQLLKTGAQPDLIISDVMMPEMDGVELCKAVKQDYNISHIPFILLSAKATVENRLEGMHTGADDYMAKPFHPALLKARIAAMIESQRRFIEKLKQDGGIIVPKDIAKNPLDEQFLQKVLNIVKLNMDKEEFSVEELGDAMAMSRSNLFRKMKTLTGQTPIEFIYYIRMKHAMELLLERKMSISEISSEVGFKNHSSFTKSFKKQYGKSPSEFLNDVINR